MRRWARSFSFHGRTGRLGYWRTTLGLVVASSLVWVMAISGVMALGPLAGWLLLLMLPVLAVNIAVAVRRLHDRGKSGWWLLVFCAMPYALIGGAQLLINGDRRMAHPQIALAVLGMFLVALGLEIWGWIEIGFLRGRRGPNRYGDPD
jgi:uncharacterized membrane protein YhaH (DUF805 family)